MSSAEDEQAARGGKRERTRAALVAAALEIIEEKGFAAASLEAIAARAGMTKGAIYSNFASKAELMIAAMGEKGLTLRSGAVWDGPLHAGLMAFARDLAAGLRRASGGARFAAEFQLYALGDPEVRAGIAAVYAASFAESAAFFAHFKDLKPGVSPRRLAVVLQSVGLGLMVQSFLTPDEITPEVVTMTLKALADGVAEAPA